MDEARVAMRIQRGLRPRDTDNFGLFTSDTLMDLWRQFSQGAFAVLIGIVSLSLLVGGIVIMNIMLMVVSERTREIGLRKALGARKRDIVWQVLTESTTLSVVGGVVGTVARLRHRARRRGVQPAAGRHPAVVRRPRHRHDGRSSACSSGSTRRSVPRTWTRSKR